MNWGKMEKRESKENDKNRNVEKDTQDAETEVRKEERTKVTENQKRWTFAAEGERNLMDVTALKGRNQ